MIGNMKLLDVSSMLKVKKIRKIKLMNLPKYRYLNGQTDPKMAIVHGTIKANRFQSGFRVLKKKIKQNKQ